MHPLLQRLFRPQTRLREFAETEAFGAVDLARAAGRSEDPWVRRQLLRHAEDELRHADLLNEAAERAPAQGLGAALSGETAAAQAVDMDAMGEVGFLAFVHLAEQRATEQLAEVRDNTPAQREVFDAILADEKRHVAWTGHALDRMRKDGRGAEVNASLRRERWRRRLVPLRWIGGKLGDLSGAVVLSVVYYTVLLPFRLLTPRAPAGWQVVRPTDLERES